MGKIRSLWGRERTEAPACKLCGTFLVEEGNELTCPHCGFVAGRESYVLDVRHLPADTRRRVTA